MIGYIYHITNKQNGKKYIGKSVHIEHRLKDHFARLEKNKHHSKELQRAYNKYGKDNFIVDFHQVEVKDEDELSKMEIQEIEKYDSFHNGYNETLGGDGNKTRFSFEKSVLLYQICQRYTGVFRQIARYFNCDRSVIQTIANTSMYNNVTYNEEALNQLIKELQLSDDNLNENYVKHNDRKITEQDCLEILSVIMNYKGYDKVLCSVFNVANPLTTRLKKGLIYKDYIEVYNKLTKEEQKELGKKTIEKYQLEEKRLSRIRTRTHNPLTQDQVDYILDNKDKKTMIEIANNLGISRDRVGGIIHKKYYKDLINNYEKRHSSS